MSYLKINREGVDFQNDSEICNIGYYEGLLENERPVRVEVWSYYDITNATCFISKEDIEDISEKGLKKMLINGGIFDDIFEEITIEDYVDLDDNDFYSINIVLSRKYEDVNELKVKLLYY